ncbi:hypothetical protein [Kitasatospora sp. NBC_01300]|uniref:hypothetical protein n=1 Tax=Kitasatospora sp. NBC_01300 TaxID=2903574 RepID=UPI002F90D956|nr:hypothetical protein OG556_40905 [Kitasatospora sp. NBC_01300]
MDSKTTPTPELRTYGVQWSRDFTATSPEDAAQQAARWVAQNGLGDEVEITDESGNGGWVPVPDLD